MTPRTESGRCPICRELFLPGVVHPHQITPTPAGRVTDAVEAIILHLDLDHEQEDALLPLIGEALDAERDHAAAEPLRLLRRMAWDHAVKDQGGASVYTHFNQIAQAWIECDCHALARLYGYASLPEPGEDA